jgi:hypothetical protein
VETLQTPFYGNVSIRFVAPGLKMRAYFTVDGQTKFLNEINGKTNECSCGYPNWNLGTVNWVFNEIPAISDVELQVLQCQQVAPQPPPNGTCDWIELAVDLVEYPPIENRWKILIDVNYPTAPPSWRYSGFITFTATTPPACCPLTDGPCAPVCDQPFDPPDTNIYREPDPNICNETMDLASGAFKGLYWELREGEEIIVTPCQDPMTGEIKFKFATNFTTELDLPYNLELCPDRIAHLNLTRIDNEQEFSDYLSDSISTEDPQESCTLRQLILRHQGYDEDGNQTGTEIMSSGGIWLTAHTLAHEEEHKCDYKDELVLAKEKFDIFYCSYSIPCSTYVIDSGLAKINASTIYLEALYDFSDQAKSEYNRKINEVEVNGRDAVLKSIDRYIVLLDEFIIEEFGNSIYNDILE